MARSRSRKVSERVAPLTALQNRTCGRIGCQRVILVDTFPTTLLQTTHDRFRIT